jgi:hypothetical protein
MGWRGLDCLAQNKDKLKRLVNAVIHKMLGNYPVAIQVMGSRVLLTSIVIN